MSKNDLLLLAILAIGACWINWNTIKKDFLNRQSSSPPLPYHSDSVADRPTLDKKEILEEQLP